MQEHVNPILFIWIEVPCTILAYMDFVIIVNCFIGEYCFGDDGQMYNYQTMVQEISL